MGLNPLQQTLAACALGVTLGAIAQARGLAPLRDRVRPPPSEDDALSSASQTGPMPGATPSPILARVPPLPRLPTRGAPLGPMPAVPVEEPCLQPSAGGCLRGALAAFDEAVVRADREGRPLRVAHLGDSVVAVDKLTRRLRASLQHRFGDGGTGWVFAAAPSRWYHPHQVSLEGRGWQSRSVVTPGATNGDYGLAGAVFAPQPNGAETRVRTTRGSAARVELHYDGGDGREGVSITLDDGPAETVRPAPDAPPGWTRWARDLADGPHSVTVRAQGTTVRVAGLVLERRRGAVVDNLGLVGNSARALHHNYAQSWERALTLRGPDLVVVTLGANEVNHGPLAAPQRQRTVEAYRAVLRRIRGAAGQRACLVTSVLDAAEPVNGRLATRPTIPVLIPIQRAEALAAGCAYWDAFTWMGGRGAALRWQRFGWMEPDLTHPTTAGGARLADALLDALFATRRTLTAPPPAPAP